MRVIAGAAGGLRLLVPKQGVRPTMDRVKAAIFSSLGDRTIDARVLDLFAGTGGLGIEALSRGARSALFVDNQRSAVTTIEKNLAISKVTARVRLQDVFDFLGHTTARSEFDVIFADPPYEQSPSGERFTSKLLTDNYLPQLLAPGGVLILEKRPAEVVEDFPFWSIQRAKTYGATEVLFLEAANFPRSA